MAKVLLRDIAYARSGDKGDISNIGLMAANDKYYEVIRKQVTPEKVKEHFQGMVQGEVKIYEMPNLNSLEIVLYNALGGGATRTLRFDQTGKSMCTILLRMEVEVDEGTAKEGAGF